jgi:hypothetical protein
MTTWDVITGLFLVGIFAALIGFLWGIIRWGIISEFRTRGWRSRLARPRLKEVEAKWGVRLPPVLEEFYRSGGGERFEFFLASPGSDRTPRWFIGCFIPLTVRDISEWVKGTKLPGIPIALDGDKGFYYLPFESLSGGGSCPVLHRDLGGSRPYTDAEVAPSVEDFVRYQAVEPRGEDSEDWAEPGAEPDSTRV